MPIQVGGENVNVEQSLKTVACEYSRFSLPLAAQDVPPVETTLAARSYEKRLYSQVMKTVVHLTSNCPT